MGDLFFKRYIFFFCRRLRASPWSTMEEEFEHLLDSEFEGAFLGTEASVSYYNKMNPRKAVALTNQMYLVPFSMFFKKHSCLTAEVNSQINAYTSSGLLQNWINRFMDKKYFNYLQSNQRDREHTQLNLDQLWGAVQLCLGSFCMCICIFAMEIASIRYRWIKHVMDFFTY